MKSRLITLTCSVLLGTQLLAETPIAQSKTGEPTNILMIAIDDLNDWVGFLGGHPQAKTPNMDRLASQSIVFENAACSSVACNPSRSALMSGLAPHVTGMYSNGQNMRDAPALKNAIMLPRYFSNHGYTSMVRGKIFHHADMDPQSWDIMSNQKTDDLEIPKSERTDMTPYKDINVDGQLNFIQKPLIQWKSINKPKELTSDYQNAIWAGRWLTDEAEQATPKPFFLACGIFRPHLPWTVPAEYYARFDLETIELPPIKDDDYTDINGGGASEEYIYAKEHNLLKEVTWAYLANVAYADDCVGVILDALEKSPYKDNTIVVLWSDHGWHVGEKLRFKKSSLWEETARMPFIIKVPGVEPGRSIRPINLIDLYPTLIDLAGLPPKEGLSGRSFAPVIHDTDIEWNYPSITSSKGGFSLRNERWRYIVKRNNKEELYDHSKDPNEWHNLANNPEYDSIKQSMRAFLPKEANN